MLEERFELEVLEEMGEIWRCEEGGCGGFNKEGYFERKYTKRGEWGCI